MRGGFQALLLFVCFVFVFHFGLRVSASVVRQAGLELTM